MSSYIAMGHNILCYILPKIYNANNDTYFGLKTFLSSKQKMLKLHININVYAYDNKAALKHKAKYRFIQQKKKVVFLFIIFAKNFFEY